MERAVKIAAISAGFVIGASAAAADDGAADRWRGAYIGVHGGGGWGKSGIATANDGEEVCDAEIDGVVCSSSFSTIGYSAGAQIGYNFFVSDRIVAGVEADATFSDIGGDVFFNGKNIASTLEYSGTVRARLGVLVTPATLLYATGGAAIGRFSHEIVMGGFGGFEADEGLRMSSSQTFTGWTVGGGVETFLTDRITMKIEYLYIDYGRETVNFAAEDFQMSKDFDHTVQTVRAGLNYKF